VIVDTGVTTQFRTALLAATRKVGEWSRALVLTTHGHTDHVGNNDLADELGVPAEHYVPARDLDQMLDPGSYWVRSFTRPRASSRCLRRPRWWGTRSCRCSSRCAPSPR
jgi:glyoxylase-like metal-dependent hydrolase (beta-lactamase superfamily II)